MEIQLRGINIQDGSIIMRWRNDTRNLNNCIDRSIITEKSFDEYFENQIKCGKSIQYMVDRYDSEMPYYCYSIGSLFIRNMDRINNRCELGILPSTDFEWNEEGKIIAVKLAVEKCFSEFKMHKVYLHSFADVEDEIAMFKNCGFSEEAILKKEILDKNGEYRDLLRMSIFNENV